MHVYERTPGIASTTVEDETILISSEGTKMITLNRLGGAIWSGLEQPRSVGDLIASIEDEHPEVDRGVIERDVAAFLRHAADIGLVEFRDA